MKPAKPRTSKRGRPPNSNASIRRDGFVFSDQPLDQVILDYLYERVPQGKRRGTMMRLLQIGFLADLGLSIDGRSIIQEKPAIYNDLATDEDLRSTYQKAIDSRKKASTVSFNLDRPTKPPSVDVQESSVNETNQQSDDLQRVDSVKQSDKEDVTTSKSVKNGLSSAMVQSFKG